jgi:LPXTG-site transpeptidase (sortase) family protein
MKSLSSMLLILSIFCYLVFGYFLWQRYSPSSLSFLTLPDVTYASTKDVLPSRIVIDAIDINHPVIPAEIIGEKWQTTKDGISYLTSSPLPGDVGNSILYGHNWGRLLGRLQTIEAGDIIEIYFTNYTAKRFMVDTKQIVKTDNTEVLKSTTDQRITLYTCTGFLDRDRLVVTALLTDN